MGRGPGEFRHIVNSAVRNLWPALRIPSWTCSTPRALSVLALAIFIAACDDDEPLPRADTAVDGTAVTAIGDAGSEAEVADAADALPGDTGADLAVRNASLAPRAIDGDHHCGRGLVKVSMDAAGKIYVVMGCDADPGDTDPPLAALPEEPYIPHAPEGRMFVVVSADAGRTFTMPAPVSRGHAMIATRGSTGLIGTRTEDGGRTWSAPQRLAGHANFVRLVWTGENLLMHASTSAGSLVWTSRDGLRTATTADPHILLPLGLAVDGKGAVWVPSLVVGEGVVLNRSTDGGLTFAVAGRLDTVEQWPAVAIGPRRFFGIFSSSLVEAPLDNLTQVTRTDVIRDAVHTDVFVLIPGPGGTVAVAQHGPAGDLLLWWPHAGGVVAARNLGTGRYPSGVALSDDAIALAYTGPGERIVFTVQTPGEGSTARLP
jgi:hypothetical protein